jgi:diguanylate cyclase (GGDEF)-like protein
MEKYSARILQHAQEILSQKTSLSAYEKRQIYNLLEILLSAAENIYHGETPEHFLEQFAAHFLGSSHLLTLIQQLSDELAAIREISLTVTSSLDLHTVLNSIAEEALKLVPHARNAHIFLYQNGTISFGAAIFPEKQGANRPFATPRPDGLTATAARSGKIITVPDMKTHPLFKNAPDTWHGSIISIPLKTRGRVVGVMNISREHTGNFSDHEIDLLTMLADYAAIAIENAHLYQQVQEQAKVDVLTGLPNRRALDEKLEEETLRALRGNDPFCVLMIDLDGFKEINDTYGHEKGDIVLQQVAQTLKAHTRRIDFVARWGGDEIVIIMPQTDIEHGMQVARKLQHIVASMRISMNQDTQVSIGFSGGLAQFGRNGITPAQLLRAADAALYKAKKRHKGQIMFAVNTTPLSPPPSGADSRV